jgi:hypothetical protein
VVLAVTATGAGNVIDCQPDAVSPVNVTVDSRVPVVVLTPSSTAEVSLESTTAGVVLVGQMVHGHPNVLEDVVNVQLTGVITLPLLSVAPLTVAV